MKTKWNENREKQALFQDFRMALRMEDLEASMRFEKMIDELRAAFDLGEQSGLELACMLLLEA
jgi:hypothetical protein